MPINYAAIAERRQLPRIVTNVPETSYQHHHGRARTERLAAETCENILEIPSEPVAESDITQIEPHNEPILEPVILQHVDPQNPPYIINLHKKFGNDRSLFCLARVAYVDTQPTIDLGEMNIDCRHCGALHWMDERVRSSTITNPEFGMCCQHGKVKLPPTRRPPDRLYELFVDGTPQAHDFRNNIVQYNVAFAFTSLGVQVDHSLQGRGPPIFRIHGQLKHKIGSLLPIQGRAPSYAQLYIHDSLTATDYRMARNPNLRRDTMELLQDIISHNNGYAGVYLHAYEILQHYDAPDYSVHLCVAPGMSIHTHNLPTVDEVAVIIPGDNAYHDHRDILLTLRAQTTQDDHGNYHPVLQRISEGHTAYAPLHYVVLFPFGEPGWHWDMTLTSGKHMSLCQYTCYRLHSRPSEFSTILHSHRLLQYYTVDMFAAIDAGRLRWIQTHQRPLRIAFLNGMMEALARNGPDVDVSQLGQQVILPTSYIGGPRDHYQRFQDGMAIARYFKKIDLFITMTANPNWPEIERELLPGQAAFDRPDLTTRVFHQKVQFLIRAITKGQLFGPCDAFIYSIEFQKRGLPHVHILIMLHGNYRLSTREHVDSIIRASWPDPITEPRLFEAVKSFMVHGPCGIFNPHAPCMEDNKCTKGFPKTLVEQTTFTQDGYPLYCRPNDGRRYTVRGHSLGNEWIIPYNPPELILMYCHTNVEVPIAFRSVKYLNKYIQKEGDATMMEMRDEKDEIKQFLDGRYYSSCEATWRIFEYDLHRQVPNVVRLAVHLPREQTVRFAADASLQDIVDEASKKDTSLIAYFKANSDNGKLGKRARTLTYQEFLTLHTDGPNVHWTIRKHGFALGRMIYLPPSSGERFYLRTLLTVRKGIRSFTDMRSVGSRTYDNFHDTCVALGLLKDDGEWRICLKEASEIFTGSHLRHLFASILLFSSPHHPDQLWNQFKESICDDLTHALHHLGRLQVAEEEVYDYGLFLIDSILQQSNHTLHDFPPMPIPIRNWSSANSNRLIMEQVDYNPAEEREHAAEGRQSFNEDQLNAYNQIWSSIINNLGLFFCVNGPGGTGKTYLYRILCYAVRGLEWIVLCVASTGLAALLLPGGRTAHSMFKIPVTDLNENSTCNIPKEGLLAHLLRLTHLIIWDECLMSNKNCFEALDRTLRDIRNVDRAMGGITFIAGSDWQQILPVVVKGKREDIIAASLRRSYLWNDVVILHLRQNMRLEASETQDAFAKWLLDVGHGRLNDEKENIQLPAHMCTIEECEVIKSIYGDMYHLPTAPPAEFFQHRAILASRNDEVHELNEKILDQMAGDDIVCMGSNFIEFEAGRDNLDADHQIPTEYLQTLMPIGLPPTILRMKKGCPLTLLRNLAPHRGLCNGTRLLLLEAKSRVLEVMIIGNDFHGHLEFIPRITLTPEDNMGLPILWKRHQFPVRLAYAMTINKAQGQSLKYVGIDLRMPVFAHGQLYVALSRATNSDNIKILLPTDHDDYRTPNIVYREVLID